MNEKKLTAVVVATGLYAPEIGGPATHTAFIEKHQAELGVAVTVVPFAGVRRYPKVVRHLVYTWQLWRALRTADQLYVLDPVSVGVPAWLAAWLRRRSYVLRLGGDYAWEQGVDRAGVQELPHEFHNVYKRYGWLVRTLYWLQARVARSAAVVITPSEYLKQVVSRWGVAADRITVIYNPYEAPTEKLDGVRPPTIVAGGRLIPLKGLAAVIEALEVVRTAVPDATLTIVGDGPLRESLQTQVTTQGLTNAVRFTGRLQKTELAREFAQAQVFVQNSLHESFPNILLEAMGNGAVVVATAVGGTPEVVMHEKNGLLIGTQPEELSDALVRVLSDASLREQLVAGGHAQLKQFHVSTVLKQIGAVLVGSS